jgi:capsular exopolysaccharide synthesis family protein
VVKSEVNNLFVLPSGQKPANPSELVSSDIMEKIIQTFRRNFDIVIFDSPPAGMVSDPIVLGQWVEKIVLVSKSRYTKYEDISSCIRKLSGLENKIIGQIVNAVDMKKQGYSDKYYYSEYY